MHETKPVKLRAVGLWLWSLAAALCLLGGVQGGRLWAQKLECNTCYDLNTGIGGKYNSQTCYYGVCQGGESNVWCYAELCKACKKKPGCTGGCAVQCPNGGLCSNGKPVTQGPLLCVNACKCGE
jgi:hypothetical protein